MILAAYSNCEHCAVEWPLFLRKHDQCMMAKAAEHSDYSANCFP